MRLSSAVLASAFVLAACTGPAAIVASLIPPGTIPILLGNLEKVSDENRKRVAELAQAERWDDLARLADENLVKLRANADWWLIAGYARSQLGQYPRAAEAFREAATLEPDDITAWHLLAQAYRAAGEPRRAVNALNTALSVSRDSAVTFYLLGETYSDLGRREDAAAARREAKRLQERDTAREGPAR